MEFTGLMKVEIEITIKAKNRDEALSFFDDLFPNITIENYGGKEIEIVEDNLETIEADWELED